MGAWLFRQKHPLKLFEVDGRRYAADLLTGQVIPIQAVAWELLKVAPDDPGDFSEIIEKLRQKYPIFQIYQEMKRLRELRERRILFSPESIESFAKESIPSQKERPQLFLSAEFLAHRCRYDFLTNFNHYCLLKALAKKADIYITIAPQEKKEEKEEAFDFGEIGIHPLEVQRTYGQSPLKRIMKNCDGILLLSPLLNPLDVELLYFESHVPVVVRLEEPRHLKKEIIELALISVGLAKEWDAVCFTSSWTKEWFSNLTSRNDHFYTVSNGLSLNPSSALEKQSAKKVVAQFIENEEFRNKPIIGMIFGADVQKAIPFLLKLAQRNPHLAFLVIDPILTSPPMVKPPNIALFGIQSLDDYQTLPTLFASMDLFCYTAALGTPLSLVLEALNCGIAPIVIGGEHLPEDLEDAGLLIPSTIDQFGNPDLPIEKIEATFIDLLSNCSERHKHEAAAKKAALCFSWEKAAEEILQLFRQLWSKKTLVEKEQRPSFPYVFTYYYDPSSRNISPATFYLTDGTYHPLLEGLILSLERRHRSFEIEQILSAIHPESEQKSTERR